MFKSNTKPNLDIALKSQEIKVCVKDKFARYTFKQEYYNKEEKPIEVFYTFPTPTEVALYEFTAVLGDNTIVKSICKEKKQAKKDYNKAIENGDTAYYIDRSEGNIFSIAIGNLAPKTNITIIVEFVSELDTEQNINNLRLKIPVTICERYTPKYKYVEKNYIDSVCNPSKTLEKPYSLNIEGTIEMGSKLCSVLTKNHNKFKVSFVEENICKFEIKDLDNLDRDIIINIERLPPSSSQAFTQKLSTEPRNGVYKYCTVVNIVPDFTSLPEVDIKKCHYCILIDSSGSMNYEDRMSRCKTAAQRFVTLIPIGASFDIYAFNNKFYKFKSNETDDIMRKCKACTWIDSLCANGTTEFVPVLKDIYSNVDKQKNTVLIILTDGDVTNTQDILKIIKANPSVSVFSIGIGSQVSEELVKGMATQGNGRCEIIDKASGSNDDISKIVTAQFNNAKDSLRKHLNNYKIELDKKTYGDKVVNFTTYGFDGRSVTNQIQIQPVCTDGEFLHRIAAIKLINELELQIMESNRGSKIQHMQINDVDTDDSTKKRIIEISEELNVLSNHTAFIGIECKENKVFGDMLVRLIPLQEKSAKMPKNYDCCDGPAPAPRSSAPRSRIVCFDTVDGPLPCSDGLFDTVDGPPRSDGFDTVDGPPCSDGLFDTDDGPSFKKCRRITSDRSGSELSDSEDEDMSGIVSGDDDIVFTINVSLGGRFITNDDYMATSSGSLNDLLKHLINGFNLKLKSGDKIRIELESKEKGIYEIIEIGSPDQYWVLHRL
nr:protein mono-ADP-ribosyltransferase PARP4-like [Hydra vulgaris]